MRVGLVVKPEIRGSAARATMLSRSAPSAKMAMPRSEGTWHLRRIRHDPSLRLAQAGHDGVRSDGLLLVVAPVHEYCPTSGPLAGFDVAPTVADHVAPPKVETEVGRSLQKQTGTGFRQPQPSASSCGQT